MAKAVERIRRILPEGHGMEKEWKVSFGKDSVLCYNTYRHKKDGWLYCGDFRFRLRITKKSMGISFPYITEYGKKTVEEEGIKEYLETLFGRYRYDIMKAGGLA